MAEQLNPNVVLRLTAPDNQDGPRPALFAAFREALVRAGIKTELLPQEDVAHVSPEPHPAFVQCFSVTLCDEAAKRAVLLTGPHEVVLSMMVNLKTENTPAEDPTPAASCITISPLAYLRSLWALIWGAFRYPFRTTVVDLSTGNAVYLTDPIPEARER